VLHVIWVFYSIIISTGKIHGEYGVFPLYSIKNFFVRCTVTVGIQTPFVPTMHLQIPFKLANCEGKFYDIISVEFLLAARVTFTVMVGLDVAWFGLG